jgi:hypothetical protein
VTKPKLTVNQWVIVHEGQYAGEVGLVAFPASPDAFGPGWFVEFLDGEKFFINESNMEVISNALAMYYFRQKNALSKREGEA